MLTQSDVRKRCSSTAFHKGLELSNFGRVKEFEYSIYMANDLLTADLSAMIVDFDESVYKVSVTVDEEYDDISTSTCNCDEIFRSDGMCRHCAALLSEYLRQRKAKEVLDVKWKKESSIQRGYFEKTQPGLNVILQKYKGIDTADFLMSSHIKNKVRLIPCVTVVTRNHCVVEFKIGTNQTYVLKSIASFLSAISLSEMVKYGKNLEFIHAMGAFDERSQNLIALMQDLERKESRVNFSKGIQTYYTHADRIRSLKIEDGAIDAFFEVTKNSSIRYQDTYREEDDWRVDDKNMRPELILDGKENGLFITLKTTNMICGSKRFYLVDSQTDTIFFCRESLRKEIGDFLEYLLNEEFHKTFIAAADLPAFCRTMLPYIKSHFSMVINDFDEQLFLPEKPEFELYLDKSAYNVIAARLVAVYSREKYNVLDQEKDGDYRNQKEEIRAKHMVERFFDSHDAKRTLFITKEEASIYELLYSGLIELNENMTIFASDDFSKMKIHTSSNVSVGISLKSNLLEFSMTADNLSNEDLSFLLSRYDRKKHYIRLKNGDFLNLEQDDGIEALAALKESLNLSDAQMKNGSALLPTYRSMFLDERLKNRAHLSIDKNSEFKSLVRNMKTIEDSDFEVPSTLKKIMRGYQKNGFRWMKTLKRNCFGGILADDMGLGKTLQVISLLLDEEGENALIICPASLVYNWKKEIENFAPSLTTRIIAGSAKEREEQIAAIGADDIVITSYDLVKRDLMHYKDRIFSTQVIDEAQYIKNANTQAARAVKKINAKFRIALTGTPIENRLSELWSIFDFLMPGFLYSYRHFKEEIELPVIVNKDEEKMERLMQLVRPFILRRLKGDVLKDLPDKIEETVYADLQGDQKNLYQAHVQSLKQQISKTSDQDFRNEKFQILAELTRLRQICCDPSLLYQDYLGGSEKLEVCLELIKNAVEGGHKVLVFSQFTTMLHIVEQRLEKEGITFFTLTGAIKKEERLQMVDTFNQDDTQVFFISLKAGGTGLNLTSADIVIHYDPWWNVAVQNQATDRAHRIGQKKVVTVYKLVAQGTIEEKIMEIQTKKQELANRILQGEGMDSISFSKEEILSMLM
ncbi:MAG: SNF2-related protein [Lachnospiraceae bacterium]